MRRPVHTHSGAPAELASFGLGLLVFGDRLGRFLLLGLHLIRGLLVAGGFLGRLLIALALLRRLPRALVLCRSRDGRPQQNAAGQQGGGGTDGAAQHGSAPDAGGELFGVRPLDFGSPTAALFHITSQAHKPEQSVH